VIYRKSTEKWMLFRSRQFGSETWSKLTERFEIYLKLPHYKKRKQ